MANIEERSGAALAVFFGWERHRILLRFAMTILDHFALTSATVIRSA
jgi:hypothetical protein